MYLKKRVLSILFILSSMAYGQQKITVIDAITKAPIPYSKIRYYNDDGMFSNEKGMFQLNVAKADSITIYATGYKTQGFRIKKGDSLLEMKSIEKVVINFKRKIKKTIKKEEKGYWHDTYLKCMQPNMGTEVAVYIPGYKLKKLGQLTKILIPVKTSTYVVINNKITGEEKYSLLKQFLKYNFIKKKIIFQENYCLTTIF